MLNTATATSKFADPLIEAKVAWEHNFHVFSKKFGYLRSSLSNCSNNIKKLKNENGG